MWAALIRKRECQRISHGIERTYTRIFKLLFQYISRALKCGLMQEKRNQTPVT